jgi:hypothetical protein
MLGRGCWSLAEFIFMLTHDDVTVPNAREIYREMKAWHLEGLRFVGFKDIGLPVPMLTDLCVEMHDGGFSVMLEVVSERLVDERRSIAAANEIGVDFVLGGVDAVAATRELAGTGRRYFPFVGTILGHPSQLRGTVSSITEQAALLCSLVGVDGLDLLAYRYDGDPDRVLSSVVGAVDRPIIAAGSIDSAARIDAVTRRGAWAFTIGSAIFERRLVPGGDVRAQVEFALAASHASGAESAAADD